MRINNGRQTLDQSCVLIFPDQLDKEGNRSTVLPQHCFIDIRDHHIKEINKILGILVSTLQPLSDRVSVAYLPFSALWAD